jgi:DNA-binding transcriptional MerR regulator
MRIGDLAKRARTTMRTIRYYEERGLIEPSGRTAGGFRLYEEEELRKLHLIRGLQVLDIPLARVKAFLDERQAGRPASEIAPALRSVLGTHLQEIEGRVAQILAMRDSVRDTLEILESCTRCPHEPGPRVCSSCPALAGRETIPLHMQAVIETAHHAHSGTIDTGKGGTRNAEPADGVKGGFREKPILEYGGQRR